MPAKKFKFREPEYMNELTNFMTKSYAEHRGKGGRQSFETINESGFGGQVSLNHIRELALKGDLTREDLFDINYWSILGLFAHDSGPAKTSFLTQKRLIELLSYNKRKGSFRWRMDRGSAKKGDIAGFISEDGYRHIKIDNVDYRASRLAYLYVYGHFPNGDRRFVDHINRKRGKDHINNLRAVTAEENNRNRGV